MKTSLEKTLDFALKSEGGYQCNRADPGNWTGGRVGVGELVGTKYGLSAPLMLGGNPYQTASLTAQRVKLFSKNDFRRVATESFWTPLLCDDLPIGLDLLVFDHGFRQINRHQAPDSYGLSGAAGCVINTRGRGAFPVRKL